MTPMPRAFMQRKIAAGFLLLQLSLAMTVAMVMATIGLWKEVRTLSEEIATAQADDLIVLSAALGNYQTKYFRELTSQPVQAIQNVANPLAPTVAELIERKILVNFSPNNLYGGGYVLSVHPFLIADSLTEMDTKGLTCLTTPITNPSNGRLDTPLLGTSIARAGGNSGYSNAATPGVITGFNGGWTESNPVRASSGSPISGILCMRSGYGSSDALQVSAGFLQFARRDGTAKPTGAWDMAGQNVTNINQLGSTTLSNTGAANIGGQTSTNGIVNAGNITNSGTWTNNGNANIGGTLGVSGQTTTNGISNTGNLANTGNATVGGTLGVTGQANMNGINNTGSLSNTGNVSANMMQLNGVVTAGNSCSPNGMQARISTGSVISCIGGIWTTISSTGTPAASCSATSITFGAGCQGTLAGTTSGNTQSLSMTYGSGSATYACSNGVWSFVTGSCTLPAANCSSQNVYWSSNGVSCSGTTKLTSSGQGYSVASTNGNSGSVFASCTNGSISLSSPVCSQSATSYEYPTDKDSRYYLSFNPNNLAIFCQSKGKNSIVANSLAQDLRGRDIWVCGAFNASLQCTGVTNCNNPAWAADGCWIVKTAVCTP